MNVADSMSIGNRLRAVRGRRGLRAVAAEIGVHAATISRIENGKEPDIETFKRICAWLGDDPSIYISGPTLDGGSNETTCSINFSDKAPVSVVESTALSELIRAASRAMCRGNF